MEIVLGIGIFQALTALFLIYTSQSKHKVNKFLYLILFTFIFHFAIKAIILIILKDYFLFSNLTTIFSYGYGVLLYLYVREFMRLRIKTEQRSYLWHIIPFILVIAIYIVTAVYAIVSGDKEYLVQYKQMVRYPIMLAFLGYSLLSFFWLQGLVKEHKHLKLEVRSLQRISLIFSLIFPVTLILMAVPAYKSLPYELQIRIPTYTGLVLYIVLLLQHHLRYVPLEEGKPVKPIDPARNKYEKSGLQKEQLINYALQLEEMMHIKMLYLDSNLTLASLAEKLKVPKHYITEILQNHFQQNFYQFVNSYRIKAVEQKIKENCSETILDIAFQCGFNSKSSFNTYFKNITGKTPKAYREALAKSKE